MDKIDFSLVLDSDGYYDIDIGSDKDALATAGFATSLLLSLGTDARASGSEVKNPYLRRGFIGDEFVDSFRHGSKLWLLDQSRVTNITRNAATNYATQSLQWMIDDGYATAINTVGALTSTGVVLRMDIISPNNNVQSWSYDLWQNTIGELE